MDLIISIPVVEKLCGEVGFLERGSERRRKREMVRERKRERVRE